MWYERNKDAVYEKVKKTRATVRKYILEYKLENSTCADCKISYPPHVLDFDHLYDKKFQIGGWANQSRKISTVIEEIKKCEIVCANCHRHRTWLRNNS